MTPQNKGVEETLLGRQRGIRLYGEIMSIYMKFGGFPILEMGYVGRYDLLRLENICNDQNRRGRSLVLDPVRDTLAGSMQGIARARLRKPT